MFHQTNVKPSWGSQFGLYRYRSPIIESYPQNSMRIKGSLAIAGFVMVSIFIIVIWSFIFTTEDDIVIPPDKININESLSEDEWRPNDDSLVLSGPQTRYDQYYDNTGSAEETETSTIQNLNDEQEALELRDFPGVLSRPPTSITRRQINFDNLENPRPFDYVWAGPQPSEFQKANRKHIQNNIQEIISQYADDRKNDSEMESSEAMSRKAYKISGIYTIPKIRNRFGTDQVNVLHSGNQRTRYNGPVYAYRPVSPMEVNMLATNAAQPAPNLHVVNNLQTPDYSDNAIGQTYVPQNNLDYKIKTPLSLMLDIIPAQNQGIRTSRARISRPHLQYYTNQQGVNPYVPHVRKYASGTPLKHQFHNINQQQLQQRYQNEYYDKYYRNRYFQNNKFVNYGRPYFIKKHGIDDQLELNRANRMLIHLNLFPENTDVNYNAQGNFARKIDKDIKEQIEHKFEVHNQDYPIQKLNGIVLKNVDNDPPVTKINS